MMKAAFNAISFAVILISVPFALAGSGAIGPNGVRAQVNEHGTQALGTVLTCDNIEEKDGGAALELLGIGIDARRGCCSHHHGVCGCKDHTVICCDREASPTCTCHD